MSHPLLAEQQPGTGLQTDQIHKGREFFRANLEVGPYFLYVLKTPEETWLVFRTITLLSGIVCVKLKNLKYFRPPKVLGIF